MAMTHDGHIICFSWVASALMSRSVHPLPPPPTPIGKCRVEERVALDGGTFQLWSYNAYMILWA